MKTMFFCLLLSGHVWAQSPANYYNGVDTSTPHSLRNTLHDVIDDHTRYPYTSSAVDTWDVLEIADEDWDKPNHVVTIYQNDSNAKQGGGNSFYNREHAWPKSYGFPNDGSSNYPYTDMHHLFLADSGYNSSRSNKPFDICVSGCSEKTTLINDGRGGSGQSNWTKGSYTQGVWEVWSSRKGDIARAMFYMDVRYEGGHHGITGHTEPDLILTDDLGLIDSSNTGNNEAQGYMGLLSVLILWHQKDPVDDIERQHNEAVANFQGNRNPFVDHPEWVSCVFELSCDDLGGGDPGDGGPINEPTDLAWINELHYDNSGSDQNEGVEVAVAAGTDVTGWYLEAYNGNTNQVYDAQYLPDVVVNEAEGCVGLVYVDFPGLQNGAADGVALVDDTGTVRQFISYEGTLTASNGAAMGLESIDIGVSESGTTGNNQSLQLSGSGAAYDDFVWQGQVSKTQGTSNINQTLAACGSVDVPPAQPTGVMATSTDGQVMLTWDGNSENDLAGYQVHRSSNGGVWQQLNGALVVDTMYIDTAVNNGSTYQYHIKAVDDAGQASDASSAVNASPQAAPSSNHVWINEFHYDNVSTDQGEFIEVAGSAGTDLSGWSLVLYNGSNSSTYKTVMLDGLLPNQSNGFGTLTYDMVIQNGSPDGMALINPQGEVVEFLSYEGVLTASNGPASGMTSVNVGVSESNNTPVGHSLQRGGQGNQAEDFYWQSARAETYGYLNSNQTF